MSQKLNNPNIFKRVFIYGTIASAMLGLASFESITKSQPDIWSNMAVARIYHAQAEDVLSTKQALTYKDYEKISEEIQKATINLNPGSGTLLDLIQVPETNSTYAIIFSANHVKTNIDDNNKTGYVTISNNNNLISYQSSLSDWVQYGDDDFGIGAFKIDGLIDPTTFISPMSIENIVTPSIDDINNKVVTVFGYPGLPGPGNTLIMATQYQPSTLTNCIYVNQKLITGTGIVGGGASGGPVIIDNKIIGIFYKFYRGSIISENHTVSIYPIPPDFQSFYQSFMKKFTSQAGLDKK